MPKYIVDNFFGGLSQSDRYGAENSFYEGKGIDVFRSPGYLMPGFAYTKVTKSNDTPAILIGGIEDMVARLANDTAYFIDGVNLYEMGSVNNETWNSNFDGAGHYYKAITNAVTNLDIKAGSQVRIYNISGNERLFYSYQSSAIGGAIGVYDFAGGFTHIYIGDGGTKNYDFADDQPCMEEWQSYLWIGSGQYVHRYDGINDAFSSRKLNLGTGWFVQCFITTNNYLLVCASKGTGAEPQYKRETAIFVWDGISPTYIQRIPIPNNVITAGKNINGNIIIFTAGFHIGSNPPAGSIFMLQENNVKKIYKLVSVASGTETDIPYVQRNAVDVFDNRLVFGGKTGSYIFTFGARDDKFPSILQMPHTPEGTTRVTAVKNLGHTKLYIGSQVSTPIYYLDKFVSGNETASYKHIYKDFGQKVRINYAKVYFKPLVSGDSITFGTDVDYGTSLTLGIGSGNIAYGNDGAVTSKRFDFKKVCHTLRPTINWVSGGVAISKIVYDYDFVDDL